jgi:hypothetical protein
VIDQRRWRVGRIDNDKRPMVTHGQPMAATGGKPGDERSNAPHLEIPLHAKDLIDDQLETGRTDAIGGFIPAHCFHEAARDRPQPLLSPDHKPALSHPGSPR